MAPSVSGCRLLLLVLGSDICVELRNQSDKFLSLGVHMIHSRFALFRTACLAVFVGSLKCEMLKFKVDASAEGCTGLFWRVWLESRGQFVIASDQTSPSWPRNGAVVEGFVSEEHPDFLQLHNGRALPFHDLHGTYTYLHPVASISTGFLPTKSVDLEEIYDILVFGSGPAGLMAAVYGGRGGRSVAVVGGPQPGGALMVSKIVENFPAADGEGGAEVMGRMVQQAATFGARFHSAVVVDMQIAPKIGFSAKMEDGTFLKGRSVIVATGAKERWLDLEGEIGLRGVSLHTCAYCDAHLYDGQDVCVVGGGDGALEATMYLSRTARSVTLIHRRDVWKGTAASAARVQNLSRVIVLKPFTVQSWIVNNGRLFGARIQQTGSVPREVLCAGVFLLIGRDPQTFFLPATLRNENGFVKQTVHSMTGMAGVFAAGQVADGRYQQAVTAASGGAQSAMDASRWLDGAWDGPPGASRGAAENVALRGSAVEIRPNNIVLLCMLAVLISISLGHRFRRCTTTVCTKTN